MMDHVRKFPSRMVQVMFIHLTSTAPRATGVVRRVRAILLTPQQQLLLIKRVKPNQGIPYWVAPGGGVEVDDYDLESALQRELAEELGATFEILEKAFVLRHEKAGKQLEEHFYICRLGELDLAKRHGPEFGDPQRGEYIPEAIALTPAALSQVDFKTPQLATWLARHLDFLQELA
jgi:8-oxo-dGTP pyrophosphatase MutT (NUDIX family)